MMHLKIPLDTITISLIDQEFQAKMNVPKANQHHYIPKHFRSKLDEWQVADRPFMYTLDYVGRNINAERIRYLWIGRNASKMAVVDPFTETPTGFRIFRGITGLANRPTEYVKTEGNPGFMKGLRDILVE
jgi:hypothetical protein